MKKLIPLVIIIALTAISLKAVQAYTVERNLGSAPVLEVVQGGTGASSFTVGECLYGNGTDAIYSGSCAAGSMTALPESQIYVGNASNVATATSTISVIGTTGYVGIGTTTPAYKLDVYGNVRIDGDITADNLNVSNWDTAYGWGDHAGLYDVLGQATSTLSSHTTTYNHANYDTAYGWGDHAGLYLTLNQTSPQTIINGVPLLEEGRLITLDRQLVDKRYVDIAVTALGARYYLLDASSTLETYKTTQITPSAGAEASITAIDPGDDQYIMGWTSPAGGAPTKLVAGVYDWNIFAEKSGAGNKVFRLYWTLVERKADNSEVVIATSSESNLIGVKGADDIILTLSEDYTLEAGSIIVGKVYTSLVSGVSAVNITLYYEGASDSHWEIPTNLEILTSTFQPIGTYVTQAYASSTYAIAGGAYHDGFSDFVANEHIDWTGASAGTIHATNYVDNNTTYTGGTNLTLDGTTFNVDDAFLLNTGDVGTGNYDFGGANFLEIPNGTNPTANDPGELAHDTTDNQLILDDFVIRTNELIGAVTIASTSDFFKNIDLPVPPEKDGYTVTRIACYVTGGTSVQVTLTDGTNAMDTLTCGTSITADDGSIANSSVSANELMKLDPGTVSGAVNFVSFSWYGTWVRE